MTHSLPRLRPDLVLSEQRQGEARVFIVKDPPTGRFLRLGEPACFIARQLDGATPLEVIRSRAREELGEDLSAEQVDEFVGTLRRLGLLESDGAAASSAPARRRVRGNLLYLRFPAFDPNPLLERVTPRLGFFFTPYFLIPSALLVLLAFRISFVCESAIRHDLRALWRFDAALLAWMVVLGVAAVHEFAHGVACKRFGGEVHEMGFLLIYFQPAFYCNVSDAWLFPERSRRLWVTFAGAYVEMVIWSLAMFVWRVAATGTWISFVAMVVVATSAIKTFFNLNPLIKLDGYYLLSDFLEIPNLRQRALAYLGSLCGRALGLPGQPVDAPSARERRIYVIYGVLAGAYSYWLLAYVARWFGSFLIDRYHGLGVLLFGGFLMLLLRNPLRSLRTTVSATLTAARGRRAWPAKTAVAVALPAALLCVGRVELKVPGSFTVLPLHNADIESGVDGTVEYVRVNEGDRVSAGDVIARLANPDLASELETVSAELAEKRARLHLLSSPPRTEEVDLSSAGVQKAEDRLRFARQERERSAVLYEKGLLAQQALDEIDERVAVRTRELSEARAALALLHAGHRPEEVAGAEAELAGLEARVRHLREQIQLLSIVSPVAGTVTTPRLTLQGEVGRFVKKGDIVAEVHELQTVAAEIAVAEKDIGEVRVGQGVAVKARAYPWREFEGKVVSIAAAATPRDPAAAAGPPEEPTFLVTTELANSSLLLKPGMTGYAKIACGRRPAAEWLAKSVAEHLRVEFWSWW